MFSMEKLTNKKTLNYCIGLIEEMAKNGKLDHQVNAEEVYKASEIVEKLKKMLEQLDKKATSKGNTTKNKEVLAFRDLLVESLSATPQTVSEILKHENMVLANATSQKISQNMRYLIEDGRAIRHEDKKGVKFSKAV